MGLSKLARSLKTFSRRLQKSRKRITNQVAQFLQDSLEPQGVAVVLARHMCMEMGG